jgi:hypothetical protein
MSKTSKNFKRFVTENRSPEARLKRVADHDATRNLGIISARREGLTSKEFKLKHQELAHNIRAAGWVIFSGAGFVGGKSGNARRETSKNRTQLSRSRPEGERRWPDEGISSQARRKVWTEQRSLQGPRQTKRGLDWDFKKVGEFHPRQVGEYLSRIVKGNKPFTYHEEFTFCSVSTAYYRLQEEPISIDELCELIKG